MQGAQFQSLVRELRSHISLSTAKKKERKKKLTSFFHFNKYFIFFHFFKLKDNCFTEFCGFLSYSNKNQPQVHPCPLPPDPPISLPSHHPRLSQSPCLSSLSYTANSHYLFCTWYCKFPCFSLHTSHPLPPPLPVSLGLFSVCFSIAALKINSPVPTF